MSFGGQTPTIIVLKEGTDASQGKGQIISNIQACLAVQDTIRSTLGPYGGDLLMVDANGKQTITNDGATVMKVRIVQIIIFRQLANQHSSSTLFILQHEFLQI
jgi:T-complex protein 1 subunit eta